MIVHVGSIAGEIDAPTLSRSSSIPQPDRSTTDVDGRTGDDGLSLSPDLELGMLDAAGFSMTVIGLLAGRRTVADAAHRTAVTEFVRGLLAEEVLPGLIAGTPIHVAVADAPGADAEHPVGVLIERLVDAAAIDPLAQQLVEASDRVATLFPQLVRSQVVCRGSVRHLALIAAAWSVLLEGTDESGVPVGVVDRRVGVLQVAAGEERDVPGSLLRVEDVFAELGIEPRFRHAYLELRELIIADGVLAAVRAMRSEN